MIPGGGHNFYLLAKKQWPLGGGLLGALPEAIIFLMTPMRVVNKQKNIGEGGVQLQKIISFESPIQATNDLNKNLNGGRSFLFISQLISFLGRCSDLEKGA
jgi:hypothetical protein